MSELTDLLNEMTMAPSRNLGEFTKVMSIQSESSNLTLYKLVMSTANLHESLADVFNERGDERASKYHNDLGRKLRSESNRYLRKP